MQLNYPKHLPIIGSKEEIIKAIQEHQVIVIAGDTGSGKTTQLPKMCLEAGRGKKSIIGCTQPRRIAAMSVSDRVREELGSSDVVGYKIRFHDHTSADTKIKFMTDGILLAETRNDRNLHKYDTIIIDEAHERSLNIDFLLGYLHQLLEKRKDLKLIISSATIDTKKFSRHFHDAPIIEVSGRTYPVTYQYHESDPDQQGEQEKSIVEQATDEVVTLADQPGGGDILVFMPTERDILDTVELINKKLVHKALVLPLFGRLQGADQRRIFKQSGLRKIIVATNVAETSITVPGIQAVVDTGVARIHHYNVRAGTTSLPISRISRASCDQRAGRCGRTGPGTCIRLFSEEDYLSRPQFTLPEILRSNLAEVILQMISLRLADPRKFPFIDPPAPRAINDGYRILRELGATTADNRLTARGQIMAGLPLDPRISRMIIEGAELGVLREVTIIAAVLAIQDPRIRPVNRIEQAREAHRQFNQPGSDVITFVNIWDSCKQAMAGKQPSAGLRKFCKTNYCSWQRMREWFDIHDQIIRILKGRKGFKGFTLAAKTDSVESVSQAAVHKALTSGFLRNIGLRKKKNSYQVSGNREVVLFPGSGLYNRGGQWIVAADFVHTSQLFARVVTNIDVTWLEGLGGDLCKRSWSDPGWQKKAGQVMALEKVSLFGLVIVAGRRVNYGRINKKTGEEAREIFIRDALINGELAGNYPFLQHNLDLIRRFSDMEDRLRKRGIMMDDQVLYDFYDQRLGMVYDRFTLNRFLKRKKKEEKNDTFLRMSEEDICQALPDSSELYRFPESLQTSQGALKLHYRFQPGHEEDGVSVDIPVAYYPALSSALFEWLVPGLLEEKIFYLLKGLPKRLRKLFVPLPNSVDMLMDGLGLYDGSLYPALEKIILRRFHVTINRDDWQIGNLPPHLRMRFRLCDDKGKTLHCARIFHELEPYCIRSGQSVAQSKKNQNKKLPEKTITIWDFTEPPEPLPMVDSQNRITNIFYPALYVDEQKKGGQEKSLTLKYTADLEQARQQNRIGFRFLYSLQFSKEIKAITKECKAAVTGHTASWISLGMKATAAEMKNMLLSSVLDGLFNTASGELPDKEGFDSIVNSIKSKGILKQAHNHINQILDLLAKRRQTQVILTQCKQRAGKSKSHDATCFAAFQTLLDELVPRDFLAAGLFPREIMDKKRYLQALGLRIERAEHSPIKDEQKEKRLQSVLNQLQQLNKRKEQKRSAACCQEMALYRKMVEEFRLSIFAPELKTSLPVSEKRLKQQWQKLEDSCRVME